MHLAEDDEVRQASHELALQCLLPLEYMRVLVKYLHHDPNPNPNPHPNPHS